MPSITVKGLPEETVERLRQRAASRHRSMQQELRLILEEAAARPERISIEELAERVRTLNLPSVSESAEIVRRDRDERAARAGR